VINQLAFVVLLQLPSASEACGHPSVEPVIEVGDWIGDSISSSKPSDPIGDSICELYCAIRVRNPSEHIPMCSSYSCKLELLRPDGTTIARPVEFGPRYDGMTEPSEVGGICLPWSDANPVGPYRATLSCSDDPSASTVLHFIVAESHKLGFDIPQFSWQGSNRCPSRPDFGVTPNPSLQRAPPG
jgi:hypothetical protein